MNRPTRHYSARLCPGRAGACPGRTRPTTCAASPSNSETRPVEHASVGLFAQTAPSGPSSRGSGLSGSGPSLSAAAGA